MRIPRPPRSRSVRLALGLALSFAAARPGAAAPAGDGADAIPRGFYDAVRQASVEILVNDHLEGTGWIADASGVVCTVAHAVREGSRIEARLDGAGRIAVQVLALDRGHDLALLRLPARDGGYPALPLADGLPPAGNPVYLYGHPIFRRGLLVRGNVARNDAAFQFSPSFRDYTEIVYLAASAAPGMSGGPWVDARGAVVGVQSQIVTVDKTVHGLAMAAPVDAIRELLRRRETILSPTIGAAMDETWQLGSDYLKTLPPRTEGPVVMKLSEGGPAAKAGLKEKEVIVGADGQPVPTVDALLRRIRAKSPGDTVTLRILTPNGGGERDVAVTLGSY